ncbi:hypothetical protein GW758_01070 [Candidatus Falkowbacteria bacterium]|nr:hypothetical protein [Candidatus Falkowbacteria bacterium]NCT54532.1 hypothetical protein [Candidatus Falkowbacteria bacterium]
MKDEKLEKIDLDDIQLLTAEATKSVISKNKNEIVVELKTKGLELEKDTVNLSSESEKAIDLNKVEKEENAKVIVPEKKVIELSGLSAQSSTTAIQKRREEEIDKILADGLGDIFLKMTPVKQKEFKIKGEETVKKISLLLNETLVSVNKIVELIKKWLKLIPGVNKFFLEQETKLKVDKIIKMKNNF